MNVKANYILITFIGFAAIFAGCERGSSDGGFEGYLERRLKDRQVNATKIECSKPLSSRAGFCAFQINREELEKLAKLVPRDDDNSYPVLESKFIFFDSSVGCLSSDAPKSLWTIDRYQHKNQK